VDTGITLRAAGPARCTLRRVDGAPA
jgi:hypothetical protein